MVWNFGFSPGIITYIMLLIGVIGGTATFILFQCLVLVANRFCLISSITLHFWINVKVIPIFLVA